MKIYPAIDLINGQCVRLFQGQYDQVTQYQTEPLELALEYQAAGAELLHLVDLDAARGDESQLDLISKLATALDIPIQTGGGIRTVQDIQARFDAGCQRVVIGSMAVTDTEAFKSWLTRFGAERIVAALDVRFVDGRWMPAIRGWQEQALIDLMSLLDDLYNAGLRHLLCTDIQRDGALSGANQDLYQQLYERYPSLQIQASGGVGSLEELPPLARSGASAVIIGKALLEGKFELSSALQTLSASTDKQSFANTMRTGS